MSESPDQAVILRDARAIRALVHPVRLAVVTALYDHDRQLTATQAAQMVGITPSAMSYHLRALERAGIAKRIDTEGDGRERPYVRAGTDLNVSLESPYNRAAIAATEALLSVAMEKDRSELLAAMSRREDPDRRRDIDDAVNYRRTTLNATVDEIKELQQRITDLVQPFLLEERHDAPDTAGLVALSIALIPEAPLVADDERHHAAVFIESKDSST